MYKSIILQLAKQDIKEAAQWYNRQKQGLGKRFTAAVRKKVRYILENPKHVAIRYGETRTAKLDIFPYMVHFTIDNENKTIIVSAVFGTKENPQQWTNR